MASKRRTVLGIATLTVVAGAWFFFDALATALVDQRESSPRSDESRRDETLNRYFSDATFYSAEASDLGHDLPGGVTHATWQFKNGVPSGWRRVGDVRTRLEVGALLLATTPAENAYQIVSPIVTLDAGSYRVTLTGEVLDGGLALGVLDADRDAWISIRETKAGATAGPNLYWSGQWPSGGKPYADFRLRRRTPVRVVVANWARAVYSSSWVVERVSIMGPDHSPSR